MPVPGRNNAFLANGIFYGPVYNGLQAPKRGTAHLRGGRGQEKKKALFGSRASVGVMPDSRRFVMTNRYDIAKMQINI